MDIEQLLYEEEGTSLDFKRESYKFTNANDYQKSELLKDILAFANAWRRNTAYILLGVEEVKGARSMPLGIINELDDAQLQEFVNKKTQRPITFTYRTQTIDDVKIGVIEIPEQKRPLYLNKDYGKLKRNVVYIRRGSSTDEAPPDEIMQMAQAEIENSIELPELKVELANITDERIVGNEQTITPILLDMTMYEEIGDFEDQKPASFLSGHVHLSQIMCDHFGETARPDYYRELALYQYIHAKTKQISFSITNPSNISVRDISVVISIVKDTDKFSIVEPEELPKEPKSHDRPALMAPPVFTSNIANQLIRKDRTFSLEELGDFYRIKLTFHKVQAKQTIFCDDTICISALDNFRIDANVSIYADNLPNPIQSNLSIICNADKQTKVFKGLEERKVKSGLVLSDLKVKRR
ncbi:ATP-binding protein [Paraglaciecola sp.]|uniref:AlbA family DNA-binding domain-containing protein n=1 Tax=Paraglaciecola sp. TaxID=1920173 RepID=UPI0030F3D818